MEDLEYLLEEFDDTVLIAETTSRLRLGSKSKDLQDIKRYARKMDRPEWANYLQGLVIMSMKFKIDSFISFLGKESDSVVAHKMEVANGLRYQVDTEIENFTEDPLDSYFSFEKPTEKQWLWRSGTGDS